MSNVNTQVPETIHPTTQSVRDNFQTIKNELGVLEQSSGIAYTPAGTDAVATTVQDKLHEFVSVFNFMTPTEKSAVQAGLYAIDVTTALQSALDSGEPYLLIPAGGYLHGPLVFSVDNMTLVGMGNKNTIFKAANSSNDHVFTVTDRAGLSLQSFRIIGNSANQSSGANSSIFGTGVVDFEASEIIVDDPYDWAFAFYGGSSDLRLKFCKSLNGRAGANSNAVRSGFLFGSSGASTAADNVNLIGCQAISSTNYRDGFVLDYGSDINVKICRALTAYTGFKIKTDRTKLIGNYAEGNVAGFQTQTSSKVLLMESNIAYRNQGSGFQFNQIDTGNAAKDWTINANQAIENGQDSGASTRYGFAFELTASASLEGLTFTNNRAVDQGAGTQTRGISFGTNGTISKSFISGNSASGNTVDINIGASLQLSSATFGFNPGLNSGSYLGAYPTSVRDLFFWTDNLPQSSGTVTLSEGLGTRGYVVPRAGYIRSLAVKSNANITAGEALFQIRVNGSTDSTFNCPLNVTYPNFNITSTNIQSRTLAAGDMIKVICAGDGSLLPNGSADFDAVVENSILGANGVPVYYDGTNWRIG